MKSLTIKEIEIATNGKLLKNSFLNDIDYISTSSKDIKDNTLFIPIIGEVNDGHNFMEDAYLNGCRCFLIDNNHYFDKDDITLIEVSNTTFSLGDIAKYYKDKFNPFTIGVTGSVGKTSTKDIISSVVKEKYHTLKNEGNFNNEIGLPKTIFNLDETYDVAVLEMGMSFKDEIKHLSDITLPNIAVISNIGMSHIEHFKDQEGIFSAKMEITTHFNKDNTLIINGDDKFLKTLKKTSHDYKLLSYGFDNSNDLYCTNYEIRENDISFSCLINTKEENFIIPTIAKHNIYNALSAILVGLLLDIPIDLIRKGLSDFVITKGRQTFIKKNDITIIDDSYNASLDSICSSLNVLKNLKKRRVAILGDVLEVGKYEEEIHRLIGENALNKVDYLICVGKSSKYIKDEAIKQGFNKENVKLFNNYQELLQEIDKLIKKGDTILVKASNGIGLSKVVEYLDKNYD